ncbi:MAG TPA: LysE family translocator [Terriglobales bacterium]|jgi:threonine/homoserine/homoserine lactone efflux protein
MSWQLWLLFVTTEAVLSISPGPAVLYVLSQAIRRGPGKSVWASWGILSANAMYFVLSATSLGAVIVASYKLFFLIKWVGAAYLVYLGISSFFGKSSVLSLPEEKSNDRSGPRILRDGFLLQAANPKAILFFTAILPQFINAHHNVAFQIFILGVSSIVVEFIILFTYGQLAGRALAIARSPRFEKLTNRIAGSLLICAGVGLARLRRT